MARRLCQAPDEKIFGRLASELLAELPERLSTCVLENAKRPADHPAPGMATSAGATLAGRDLPPASG